MQKAAANDMRGGGRSAPLGFGEEGWVLLWHLETFIFFSELFT